MCLMWAGFRITYNILLTGKKFPLYSYLFSKTVCKRLQTATTVYKRIHSLKVASISYTNPSKRRYLSPPSIPPSLATGLFLP